MLLIFSIMLLSLPAVAMDISRSEEQNSSKNADSIVLRFVHGNILEEATARNTSTYSNDLTKAQKSDQNPDVCILSESSEYVMAIGESQYQLADKIDVFITESSQIDELEAPQEIKDTIAQDLLNSPKGYVEGTIFAPATGKARDTLEDNDYQYKGYNMRQYLYTYKNFEATNVNVTKGIKTKERISATLDFIFTVVTNASTTSNVVKKITPYTTAASLLKDFLTATQSNAAFVASSGDSVYITPHWNRHLKFTYCDYFHNGNYFLGLKSICAELTTIEYDIYFQNANKGENIDFTRFINERIVSPNYDAPDAIAIACAATEARLEDTLIWNIYAKTAAEGSSGSNGTLLCSVYIS